MTTEVVDRRKEYYERAAATRAADPWEFNRRLLAGLRFQATLFQRNLPANVRPLRRVRHD